MFIITQLSTLWVSLLPVLRCSIDPRSTSPPPHNRQCFQWQESLDQSMAWRPLLDGIMDLEVFLLLPQDLLLV